MMKASINRSTCQILWQINTFTIAIFLHFNVHGQETTLFSGGDASGNSGSVSYSVGQLFDTIHTSANDVVAEGIQPPYEVLIITGLETAPGIQLVCYTNPTAIELTLQVVAQNISSLSYQLYYGNGRIIANQALTGKQTTINMAGLAPAIYSIKVWDKQDPVKTFKIIKK